MRCKRCGSIGARDTSHGWVTDSGAAVRCSEASKEQLRDQIDCLKDVLKASMALTRPSSSQNAYWDDLKIRIKTLVAVYIKEQLSC